MSNLSQIKGQKLGSAFQHLKPSSLSEGVRSGIAVLNYGRKVWSLRHQKTDYQITREDDGSPAAYVDVIILAASPYVSRTYYPEWRGDVEAAGKPPICKSLKGDVPDPDASMKQSKYCDGCQHAVWTTKKTGQRGTECQPNKRIALLVLPSTTKRLLGSPLYEPVFFKVPPGSFNALRQYSDELQHEGYPFAAIVTRLGFAPDKQFQLTFTAIQVLSDGEAPMVLPLIDAPQTQMILGTLPMGNIQQGVIDVTPSRVDTGLMDLSAPVEVRPAESVQYPKSNGGNGASTPAPEIVTVVDDADANLDAEVAKLLTKKSDGMLK